VQANERAQRNDSNPDMRLSDWRDGDPMNIDRELKTTGLQYWTKSYAEWKQAKQSAGWKGFVMQHINNSRRNLAKAIRESEQKLGRPHRYLPQCGAVQYV
jgi:hypothetical protein